MRSVSGPNGEPVSNERMAVLTGRNHKARFGLSVACIGNIDLDGRSQSKPKGIEVSLIVFLAIF